MIARRVWMGAVMSLVTFFAVGTAAAEEAAEVFPAKGVERLRIVAQSGSITVIADKASSEFKVFVEGDDYWEERRERERERAERMREREERRRRQRDRGDADDDDEDDEWDEFFNRDDRDEPKSPVRSELKGGQLYLKGKSGDVKVYAPKGIDISVQSKSGELNLKGSFGQVEIKGWSGGIQFKGSASSIEAKTLSGDLEVDAKAPVQQLVSISGDVQVKGAVDDLTVASTSGDVEVRSMPARMTAKTVSGEVKVKGNLPKGAVHDFEAVSGDVFLWITNQTGFKLAASSFDSDIQVNNESFEGQVKKSFGDGSATLRVTTMNGEVRIKHGK